MWFSTHFPHSWYQLFSPAVCVSCPSTFFESRYSVLFWFPWQLQSSGPWYFPGCDSLVFPPLTCSFEAPCPVCLFQEHPLPILWIQPPPIHQHFTHTLSWNISIFIGMASSFVACTELPHSRTWHGAWHKVLRAVEPSVLPSASRISCGAGVWGRSKRAGSPPPADGSQDYPGQGLGRANWWRGLLLQALSQLPRSSLLVQMAPGLGCLILDSTSVFSILLASPVTAAGLMASSCAGV